MVALSGAGTGACPYKSEGFVKQFLNATGIIGYHIRHFSAPKGRNITARGIALGPEHSPWSKP
ncbi:hypothetical protein DENIS_2796 [Desulfonema ishimotonii]|uniref:Uncharacterized protein n=1 Tax=Desulfonema ishimotonii TaxID=45657 RepID=A0A401FY22_9BACT|nr:hypothetical protein DENIS_2796 [Desulfonema ishimotonii]